VLGRYLCARSLCARSLCARVALCALCVSVVRAPLALAQGDPPPALTPSEGPWWLQNIKAWWSTIDGAEVTLSKGGALLTASAREGSFTQGRVAQGSASFNTASLSLYSDPHAGWQWAPVGGLSLLSSGLSDLDQPLSSPNRGRGELVEVVCQRFDAQGDLAGGFGDCALNNRYDLTLLSASLGASGGYTWLFKPTETSEAHAQLAAEWRPLSLRWTQSSLGGVEVNDEWSWSWLGAVRAIGTARLLQGAWGVGASASLEWTPAVTLNDPVEFRGAEVCGPLSCARERVLVDQLSLLAWALSAHLIHRW
jgi:hypothetical protein